MTATMTTTVQSPLVPPPQNILDQFHQGQKLTTFCTVKVQTPSFRHKVQAPHARTVDPLPLWSVHTAQHTQGWERETQGHSRAPAAAAAAPTESSTLRC
ncbi:hypothetical protein COCON_G00089230 [Conger conger]|uniref:Uncharacterized protein n=1 Tax=Conger conger TaxID=82655 RepID=A0A9Q1I0P6_CONCO|nr:hypothetical protein COCON_G00089230 [Conger conger]